MFKHSTNMGSDVSNRLKELRLRAGLSMDKLAKALGYKGQSSYQRYEDSQLYKKKYLPYDLVEKLLDVLPGKGEPPILPAEVLRLSGSKIVPLNDWDEGTGFGMAEPGSSSGGQISSDNKALEDLKHLYKGRNDVGFFIVSGNELNLRGVFPGDIIVTSDKTPAEKGSMVCLNVYDEGAGTARTQFRIYEPPNAIAVSSDPSVKTALPVDGEQVMLRGTVLQIIRTLIS